MAVGVNVSVAGGDWPALDDLAAWAGEVDDAWPDLTPEERAAVTCELAYEMARQCWATLGLPAVVLALVADAREAGVFRFSAVRGREVRTAAADQFADVVDGVLALPQVTPEQLTAINQGQRRRELGAAVAPIDTYQKEREPTMAELQAVAPLLREGLALPAISRETGITLNRVRRVREALLDVALSEVRSAS